MTGAVSVPLTKEIRILRTFSVIKSSCMGVTIGIIPNAVRLEDGVFKVGDSRVSLDSVIHDFNNGADATEIQHNYDSLSLAQVHSAIAYYLHNKASVDDYLAAREQDRDRSWQEHEAQNPRKMTREILLRRKNGEDPAWRT